MGRSGLLSLCVLAAVTIPAPAPAAVSEAEAARLRADLTPVGAERAGNADGSIPPWTGGFTTVEPGFAAGMPRPDPFAGERPLFSITAANSRDYAARLPEGALRLFADHPGFRMDIYPAHRTAAAPASVYDSIFRNATRARPAAEGIAYGIEGAAGGIPFPIPADGTQAMWNHLLAFWGAARELTVSTYVVTADGQIERTSAYAETADFPYYAPGTTPESLDGYYFKTLHIAVAPPARAGEAYLNWQPLNIKRHAFQAWRLLPGEHRVRKAPGISYDVPDTDAAGFMSLDEYYLFFGGLDHYEFRLRGKAELFVPYNNNRLYTRPAEEVLTPGTLNPDLMRYELHRVWVVEGTLAPGAHDIVARRRLYLDEDTWMAVYAESWDERGRLWKFAHATMYLMPDVPAVVIGSQAVYDFELGGYAFAFAFNPPARSYSVTAPHPPDLFTPEALAARSVR